MANYKTIAPVEGITGKLNKKDKTVFRQKIAHKSDFCSFKNQPYANPRHTFDLT